MSDDQQEHEEAYPGHGPHADTPTPEDHSDPVEQEVEDRFPVTPGTETPEERAKIAEDRVAELDEARGGGDSIEKPEDEDDDEPELSDESDDEEPVQPADDSPVHDEDTVQPGDTNPAL
jgi:hypothetical protein